MILDYERDGRACERFSVVDAATGEVLDRDSPYFYADDEAGVLRCYDRNEGGLPFLRGRRTGARVVGYTADGRYAFADGTTGDGPSVEVAWTEHRRAIRIVPRDGVAPEPAAPSASWRDRPPLL